MELNLYKNLSDKTANLQINSNWLFPLSVVTISPTDRAVYSPLCPYWTFNCHVRRQHQFGVNLTKGELYRTQNEYYEVVKYENPQRIYQKSFTSCILYDKLFLHFNLRRC